VPHSGVVFRRDGQQYFILTALHAITQTEFENQTILVLAHDQQTANERLSSGINIGLSDYYSQFPAASIEYFNEDYDLAVLSFNSRRDFAVLPIASNSPEFMEPVASLGNPYEDGRNNVSTGVITSRQPIPFGVESSEGMHRVVTHSAKVSPGSSGSALLNQDLEIVGINLSGDRNIFRIFLRGRAIPCDKIIDFLYEMERSELTVAKRKRS
jgi:S1-C subfamily serine protease